MIFYLFSMLKIVFAQLPLNYELDINSNMSRQLIASDSMFTSNGIMDIRSLNDEFLFLGTNDGLSFIDLLSNDNFQYGHPISINFPKGGNPSLSIKDDMIIFSGVIDTLIHGSHEVKGTGLAYSRDGGESWFFLSQPIDSIPEEEMDGFQTISWGGQDILSLSVTTDINNVSYDIAIDDINHEITDKDEGSILKIGNKKIFKISFKN